MLRERLNPSRLLLCLVGGAFAFALTAFAGTPSMSEMFMAAFFTAAVTVLYIYLTNRRFAPQQKIPIFHSLENQWRKQLLMGVLLLGSVALLPSSEPSACGLRCQVVRTLIGWNSGFIGLYLAGIIGGAGIFLLTASMVALKSRVISR